MKVIKQFYLFEEDDLKVYMTQKGYCYTMTKHGKVRRISQDRYRLYYEQYKNW